MPGTVNILGIRHHGPGSARSLQAALRDLAPDCVLVEGPPEADGLIAFIARAEMVPPVAILVYRTDNPRRSSFFPFAAFSPEWVALKHALAAGVPARFIDLPQAHGLADPPAENETENGDAPLGPAGDGPIDAEGTADDAPALAVPAFRRDPLGELAMTAGYPDGDRWWDDLVESRATAGRDIFEAVAEAMAAVRDASPPPPPDEAAREEAREAYMRGAIRQAVKDGRETIAVVCGAWHVPALRLHDARGQASKDAAALRGLPRAKTAAAWAPWSYERLSAGSGYGAGVDSPEWYHAVWHHGDGVAVRWLAQAAALLRSKDLDASPASVVEAARLSTTLAGLRGRSRPALDDLREAAASTMCFGDATPMRFVADKLIVGDRIGSVPPDGLLTPVQADFEVQAKRLRLATSVEVRVLDLDLRNDTDLARSHFLNRLALIGVRWGERRSVGGKGTFKEGWTLRWNPVFAVDLVAAARDSASVADAAAAIVRAAARRMTLVAEISQLVGTLLDADLPAAAADVVAALDQRASVATDVFDLMEAVPPLAELARYGSVRSRDTERFKAIVARLVPRVAAGLVAACQSLDDEAAARARARIEALDRSLATLADEALNEEWRGALASLADQSHVHGLVVGRATRLLLEAKAMGEDEVGRRLGLALSSAASAGAAAAWFEGMLAETGTLLAHSAGLRGVVDDWICGLDADRFIEVLPLARRTFATMQPAERRAIGEALATPGGPASPTVGRVLTYDADRAAIVYPTLAAILGPRPDGAGGAA